MGIGVVVVVGGTVGGIPAAGGVRLGVGRTGAAAGVGGVGVGVGVGVGAGVGVGVVLVARGMFGVLAVVLPDGTRPGFSCTVGAVRDAVGAGATPAGIGAAAGSTGSGSLTAGPSGAGSDPAPPGDEDGGTTTADAFPGSTDPPGAAGREAPT